LAGWLVVLDSDAWAVVATKIRDYNPILTYSHQKVGELGIKTGLNPSTAHHDEGRKGVYIILNYWLFGIT
jgi:hypothetical protein